MNQNNTNGTIGTMEDQKFPTEMISYLQKHFNETKFQDIQTIVYINNTVFYTANIRQGDMALQLVFDSNGKLLENPFIDT